VGEDKDQRILRARREQAHVDAASPSSSRSVTSNFGISVSGWFLNTIKAAIDIINTFMFLLYI
jgi:hypothetical protein